MRATSRALPPIKGTADQIADQLRLEIEAGMLPPDAVLNQVELAARFGLSRIPIREALRQLEADGYVNYRPNKGATVITSLTIAEILEVLEIRQCLESRLMQHAMKRLNEKALARADVALDLLNAGRTATDLRGKHEHFHSILFEAAERPRMAATINEWRFRYDRGTEDDRMHSFAQATRDVHDRLLDACRHRDADAVQSCIDDEYAIIRASLTR